MNRARYLHLALAGALLALLLWKTGVTEVADALRNFSPLTAAAVVALNIPIALLFGARSHVALRCLGHSVPAKILLPIAVLGNVAGALTPASAGELLRTATLKSHADVGVKDGFALVLYERALSVYLMALWTGTIASFVSLPLSGATLVAVAGLLLSALPIFGAVILRRVPRQRISFGPSILRDALEPAAAVADRLRCLLRDRRQLTWAAITGGIFALVTLQFWLLARELSNAISPQEAWIAFGASQLAGIVSLVPLGLGAADGSLAALLRRMGATLEQGTGVAVLVRATITLPMGIAAVCCYLYLQRLSPRASSDPSSEREHASRIAYGGGVDEPVPPPGSGAR